MFTIQRLVSRTLLAKKESRPDIMKIIQILPELNQGGVERGTVERSRELVRRGHQSIVISAGGLLVGQIEADGGRHITLDVCSKNPLNAPIRIAKLKKLLKELNPDIVHARSRVPAWMCVFAMKGMNIPFVTTVHGFNSVSAYSKVMTSGERVICVSSAIKDYIRKHYNTPEEKISIIHRGLDPEEFDKSRLDLEFMDGFEAKFGLKERYVVACVGRITPLKNFEMFINAIKLASDELPNIKGLIVGGVRSDKEEYFGEIKVLVKKLNLDDKIEFTGPQSKMAEIYAMSDLVVNCSKKPEAFGRSLIEAMAMGTPVIAPAIGGPLDIIEDGKNGFLFEQNDIKDLAEKIGKISVLTFNDLPGYAQKKFSLNIMVDSILSIYWELINE